MDKTGLAILITFAVIIGLLVLGFLVWYCCCRKSKITHPCIIYYTENHRLVFKKRWDVVIKKCDQSSTDLVENQIIHRLQQDMHNKGLRLVEGAWDQALDEGQKPVIVFCVISSRIGTDIENAMRGVNGNNHVILVLLHCILSSLLKGDLCDEEELLESTMKNTMKGITHFAFSDREGLYDCHQNRIGSRKLLDLVSTST